jgi:superfamily I DNA/RNA helicase
MTESQYKVIDMFSSFNRLLIEGGAGTGKTFLLLYAVKFESTNNKKIAIITKPQRLLNFLKKEVNYDSNIHCYDANTLLDCQEDYFDVVLIDEGQDWCNSNGIDVIDKVLKGGLENGRWRWFGDFENQFDKKYDFDDAYLDYLKTCTGNNSIVSLDRNVRNTPQIVMSLEKITKARVGKTTVKGAGPEVKNLTYNELDLLLNNYENFAVDQSTILYVNKVDLQNLPTRSRLKHDGCDFCQIDEFKGMESNYIFIIGFETVDNIESFRDLYYKSVSRSTGICYIVTDEKVIENLLTLKRS